MLALSMSMRPEDVAECEVSMDMNPLDSLVASVSGSSYARTLLLGGEVAAIYGVASEISLAVLAEPEIGLVWALTGRAVNRYPKAFLRCCRSIAQEMLMKYPAITNVVDARYSAALRWAKWLGFEVFPARPFGPRHMPFHQILMRRTTTWAH